MYVKQEIIDKLYMCGIKPSVQRIAIMEYLMTHRNHPTVDVIFSDLYLLMPTLSKTTVYNTLKLLVEHGAILAIMIEENVLRYDGDTSLHAHFKCKKCGKICDLHVENLDSVLLKSNENIQILEKQLYCSGYCAECRARI